MQHCPFCNRKLTYTVGAGYGWIARTGGEYAYFWADTYRRTKVESREAAIQTAMIAWELPTRRAAIRKMRELDVQILRVTFMPVTM